MHCITTRKKHRILAIQCKPVDRRLRPRCQRQTLFFSSSFFERLYVLPSITPHLSMVMVIVLPSAIVLAVSSLFGPANRTHVLLLHTQQHQSWFFVWLITLRTLHTFTNKQTNPVPNFLLLLFKLSRLDQILLNRQVPVGESARRSTHPNATQESTLRRSDIGIGPRMTHSTAILSRAAHTDVFENAIRITPPRFQQVAELRQQDQR